MKIIIAGSRTISDKYTINAAIFRGINKVVPFNKINEIIILSGAAAGVDAVGEDWAKSFGFSVQQFIPQWDLLGKKAGYIRNKAMVDKADALIAIWDGVSKGTKITIDLANAKKIPVYVEIIK